MRITFLLTTDFIMTRHALIEDKITQHLSPSYLTVENESRFHHVPEGSETHFKVIAVSSVFTDLSRVARHRMINGLLAHEFETGLHALSLHLYTPDEWFVQESKVLKSPACKDGFEK